jgi:hypothetical protein
MRKILAAPLILSPRIWKLWKLVWGDATTKQVPKRAPLEYLSYEDESLGSAIMLMARCSAWGKWCAAQWLATAPNRSYDHREWLVMEMASSVLVSKSVSFCRPSLRRMQPMSWTPVALAA